MARSTPIPVDDLTRIEEIAPEARLARRQHSATDPKVLASKELTAIFKRLRNEGCSISNMAKAADMTYHSVAARIKSDG